MFRRATDQDLVPLTDLERDANVVALAHVFPPDTYPFPYDDVLARWRLVLDDPTAVVLVLDDPPRNRLGLYLAYDDTMVRHVAVHPDLWGQGLASAAMRHAAEDMARRGTTEACLWVLAENHRARAVYEHLGWTVTAERREAPWRPHPIEIRYTLRLPA